MPAAKVKKRVTSKHRGPSPAQALSAELRTIAILSSTLGLIGWDQETMMPAKGAALRAQQREALSTLIHKRRTSPRLGDLIKAAEAHSDKTRDPRALANAREARRDYDRATRMPASLVAELAGCGSRGMEAWKEARARSDFRLFLPWLTRTIELSREKAACLGAPRGGELYDALLEEYEPGMTAARVREIFGPLRARLVPMIDAVAGARTRPSEAPARRPTPIEAQKRFAAAVCGSMGFDFESGRLDESAHPFCEGLGPGDTRMTNRYRADGWTDALGTAMHESGHGLYEQGLPKEARFGEPLAEAASLGVHESQSRMWENHVGRSRAFWTWASKLARATFGRSMGAVDALYKAVNVVRPGLIRVESDELTYNLHIMLRFDLERAMIAGDLAPRELSGAWNRRMKDDLGLKVPDDRRGCLQDVHWSAGYVGYFPTYTLGNLYAAQFWEAMGAKMPDRDKRIARGEFAPILSWLRANIHAHGRRYTAGELCQRATGAPLSHDALLRHLARKVKSVYGV